MSVGKRWERELRLALEHELDGNGFIHRIRDNTYAQGRRQGSIKTPADLVMCGHHCDLLIECKARKAKSIPFDSLATHQAGALSTFSGISERHVGVIAVLLYNGKRGKGRMHNGYLVPWRWWYGQSHRAGRKSIPIQWLDASAEVVKLSWEKSSGTGAYGWVLPPDWHRTLAPTAEERISRQRAREDTASPATRRTSVEQMIAKARRNGVSSRPSRPRPDQQN